MNNLNLKKILNVTSKILAIIISVILGLIIILNISLWIHQKITNNSNAKIFGLYPLIVKSNSMYPTFKKGDLIFSKPVKEGEITVGDIISFENIYTKDRQIVTHRIENIYFDKGIRKFTTKGDSNSFIDTYDLDGNYILGKYTYKIPGLGGFIELIRQPITLILIFISVILAYVLVYMYRRLKNKKITTNS